MSNSGIKKGTAKRLFKYISKKYKLKFILICFCIVLSSIASVASSLFLQTLIDDYIMPLIGLENPIFNALLGAIGVMGIIFLVGVLSGYFYNRTMALVAQGILKDINIL